MNAQTRTIETAVATLSPDEKSGDLVGVRGKSPDLNVIAEPRLGENFRIVLPQLGYEGNYFKSRDQKVSKIEPSADGVLCTYDSLTNDRKTVPLKVRYRIRVAGEQLQSSVEVDNPSARKITQQVLTSRT